MKIKLLVIALVVPTVAFGFRTQEGVIVRDVGASRMFIFQPTRPNPHGDVHVGETIRVQYALHITRNGRARFVAFDGSLLSASALKSFHPRLHAEETQNNVVGFIITDTSQRDINVYLRPKFAADFLKRSPATRVSGFRQTLSREGNLDVQIEHAQRRYRIKRVTVE